MLKRIKYNAPVVLSFTLISFIALGLGYVTNGWMTRSLFMVYRSSWGDPLAYVRIFTHVLGHADWNHFINNMMFILLLGPMLEEKYGSRRLLLMIVVTAFVTGLINILFFRTALLGASGIVFMFILLSSFGNTKERTIPLTLILVAVLYVGNEVLSGVFSKDHISQLTHILGGFCGGAMGFYYSKK